MKIINFISGKDLGGPKQSFILYTELLEKMGHTVTNVIKAGAKLKPVLLGKGYGVKEVNYYRTPFSWMNGLAKIELRKVMGGVDAEVVFVHKPIDISLVREALGDNIKIIAIIHGFSNKYLEDADSLVAVSENVGDFLKKAGVKKPIFVIPNMVKIESEPTYRDIPEIPLIGAMGVFRRKKGFHIFIRALSILKEEGIGFKAVIAGKGQLYYYLKYLRIKLNLQDELTIRGWVSNDERDRFVDDIDLYVLPSRTETFGMVVVEAMARMKRVIATKCGGPEEIITCGVNGYLVEKENPEDLARQLKSIIQQPKESKRVAMDAAVEAKERYTLDALMERMEIAMKTTSMEL
jgi:glycosyltransferase involved in cell wall biosynthesis